MRPIPDSQRGRASEGSRQADGRGRGAAGARKRAVDQIHCPASVRGRLALAVHALLPAAVHAIAQRLALAGCSAGRPGGTALPGGAVERLALREGEQRTAQHHGETDEADPELLQADARHERSHAREHHEDAEHQRAQVKTGVRGRGLHHIGLALVEQALHVIKQLLFAL